MQTRTINVRGKQPTHGQRVGQWDYVLGVASTNDPKIWRCIVEHREPAPETDDDETEATNLSDADDDGHGEG